MKKEVKNIFLLIILICSLKKTMAQNSKDTSGRTVLTYNTVNADFGPLNGRAKIIEATIDYSLISLDGKLFMVFATPVFNEGKWWMEHYAEVGSIQRLVLQPSHQYEKLQEKYCELPTWVAKLTGLTYLRLNQVFVDRLDLLKDTEIKFLEFNNVKFQNKRSNTLIDDIKNLKRLRGIAYDDSVPLDIVHSLKMGCVNCELYLTTDESQKQKFMHDLNIDL
ncbi:hypothetical protein [Mucilaginibacter sp. SJ]|uniref:hypothetical protein n=1 Tax=Mucilaginibacter sp. SJ TaxID=3029053 RepID=UPI0023AA1437|nr:hypothetical protein [Mucilaginibacter sp. SJ]WEA02090.1 hypothetical protein MusilaSJ_04020 [Mucilaginibacter sp. SJ]